MSLYFSYFYFIFLKVCLYVFLSVCLPRDVLAARFLFSSACAYACLYTTHMKKTIEHTYTHAHASKKDTQTTIIKNKDDVSIDVCGHVDCKDRDYFF